MTLLKSLYFGLTFRTFGRSFAFNFLILLVRVHFYGNLICVCHYVSRFTMTHLTKALKYYSS